MRVPGRVALAPFALVLIACATSPTGRKRLLLVPESQMNELGAQAFQELKRTIPIETDAGWRQHVACVAGPITEAARGRTPVTQWEIVVFRDDSANAFALPGGRIGVHTGLLRVARTDAQLATVIAHEVGHVIARHSNERVSEGIVAESGLAALGSLAGDAPKRRLLLGLLGVGVQVGVILPHSRSQEREADLIGLDLMARAGFDPRESVALWQNMMAASGGKSPPEFLSTHPASRSRIETLRKNMGPAVASWQSARGKGRQPACPRPSQPAGPR